MPQRNFYDDKPRVLILEDEIELREILIDCLTIENLYVTGCGSVQEAIRLLREGPYDLLIADWRLQNGVVDDLLCHPEFIGKLPSAVMIMTGYHDHPLYDREFFSGYTVLTKPFSLQEFIQTALRLILRHSILKSADRKMEG
jgi:DNA-binding NtrC family response regulator